VEANSAKALAVEMNIFAVFTNAKVKLHNNVYLLFHCMEKVIFVPICVDDVLSKCSPPWLTIINTYSKINILRYVFAI
jgi:hypothetical protein